MDVSIGYLLAAVCAPAIIIASAGAIRRRNVPPLEDAESQPEQGMLEQRRRKGYTSTSVLAVLVIVASSAALYVPLRLSDFRKWQCAVRDAGTGTVVLERFKSQSRNFNSTPQASHIPTIQTYFDAGMFYSYGFDHIEALNMFTRAGKEDAESKCSLCTWGKAYALGPFVNRVMRGQPVASYPAFTCKNQQAAHAIAEKAKNQAVHGSDTPLNLDLTDAMVKRYMPAPTCNTTVLRNAELQYARQLSDIAYRHKDATAAALAAEAFMNVHAWKYTLSEKQHILRRDTQAALDLLNFSLELEPRHVLGLHLKIHLLETQPLHSSHDDGDATLSEGETAADALAKLSVLPEMPGHLVHMPCHIYIRTGRWAEAVTASKASAQRDQQDSDACQVAYAPEHNLDMALFAAVMVGDSESALWSAKQLALIPKQQLPGYISQGTNHAAAVEVALFFGRCSDTDVRQARGSRGRSGTLSGPYMAVLAALRAALCEVQSFHENSRAHGSSQVSAAQESKLNQLVASVEQAASTVAKDTPTKPGYGLGLYSAGYHSLAQIYSLLAKAAQACVQQRWDQAVRHLARAVKLETGMGYIEPPRMVMTLQPCLASVLVLSGDFVAGNKVVTESLERFPGTAWGRQAEAAVALAADEEQEGEVQKAAQSACKLIFGSSHL